MWFGWWKKIFSMRKEFVTMHAYMDLIAHNFGISLLCLIPSRKPVWPAAFLPALQLSVRVIIYPIEKKKLPLVLAFQLNVR